MRTNAEYPVCCPVLSSIVVFRSEGAGIDHPLVFGGGHGKNIHIGHFVEHFYFSVKIDVFGDAQTRSRNIADYLAARKHFKLCFRVHVAFNLSRNAYRIGLYAVDRTYAVFFDDKAAFRFYGTGESPRNNQISGKVQHAVQFGLRTQYG